jgi:hypothetical protein
VKRTEGRNPTEFDVNPPSPPSIYAWHVGFVNQVICVKAKVPVVSI